MSYYPRQMINQIKKMDEIIPDRDIVFTEIKNKILSIDNSEKIVKTVKIVKNKHEISQQKQTDNQKIIKVKKMKLYKKNSF